MSSATVFNRTEEKQQSVKYPCSFAALRLSVSTCEHTISLWKIADLQAHSAAPSAALRACRSAILEKSRKCVQIYEYRFRACVLTQVSTFGWGSLKQHVFRGGSGGQITYNFEAPWHEKYWETQIKTYDFWKTVGVHETHFRIEFRPEWINPVRTDAHFVTLAFKHFNHCFTL